jgi:hypothetical protein
MLLLLRTPKAKRETNSNLSSEHIFHVSRAESGYPKNNFELWDYPNTWRSMALALECPKNAKAQR